MEPAGSWPERPIPGSRNSTTRFCWHLTPTHKQGVDWETFQSRDRPPTAERSTRRAALSEARSDFPVGSKIRDENVKKSRK